MKARTTWVLLLGGLALGLASSCGPAADQIAPQSGAERRTGPPEIRCPLGQPPKLDGVIGKGEWDDALTVRSGAEAWTYDAMAGKSNISYKPKDLACTLKLKHDGKRLYLLGQITDDLLYKLDTPEWAPAAGNRAKPYWQSPAGQADWGWWGDCFELAICANLEGGFAHFPFTGPGDPQRPGECWKIQGNISYNRVMAGKVMQPWVAAKYIQCAMKPVTKPRGYILEWSIALNPCLATGGGKFYTPGKSAPMGLQLMLIDLDEHQSGQGHWSNIHHQAVWSYSGAGGKKERRNWGRLVLDPKPLPK